MGKNSDIEWTHHTFNPWWGCAKVSPACNNCYAEAWAKRTGHAVWGSDSPRRFFTAAHWAEPLKWNADAGRRGVVERVFCASMADVFEDREDLSQEREKLWKLIDETPYLNWLLLTKRPQNISKMAPWAEDQIWPPNVWLGTTVESQAWAKSRLPHLLKHNSSVRFLSCEPLLGSLDLLPWLNIPNLNPLSWVIAGGESGAQSRPMKESWLVNLRDFCLSNGIAFHFKQWGHWVPAAMLPTLTAEEKSKEFTLEHERVMFVPLGKKLAGRKLQGRTYDGLPKNVLLLSD